MPRAQGSPKVFIGMKIINVMRTFLIFAVCLSLLGLCGCAGPFKQAQFLVNESFRAPDFHLAGSRVGFITLSSANRSEDRSIVTDLLGKILQEKRGEIEVLPLSQSLSLINRAGMAKEYNEAIREYQTSGILDKKIITSLGELLNVHYLLHLNLIYFDQYTSTRFSLLGLRAIDSQSAKMRLFVQILQTDQGTIVWEASGEGIITREEFRAKPISFHEIARLACQRLAEKLP
jgi:hypothetical protein